MEEKKINIKQVLITLDKIKGEIGKYEKTAKLYNEFKNNDKKKIDQAVKIFEQLEKNYQGDKLEKILSAAGITNDTLKKLLDKEIPKEVAINNLKTITDKLEELKNSSFKIVEQPKWYKPFSAKGIIDSIKQLTEKILKVDVQNDILSVHIKDSKGNIIERFGVTHQAPLGAGGKSGSATEVKQDQIITKLQTLIDKVLDRTTDNVGAALQTDAIMNDTTALTPKYEVIDDAVSGNNTIVSAVTDKKIRVLALFLVASDDVNVRFESGAGGTALTGQVNLVANTGFVLPFNPVGWFETGSNTLLNLELSGAVSVDGSLVYVEV